MVDVKLWKLGCQNREGYVMKYNAVASQTISHGETLEIEIQNPDSSSLQYQNAVLTSGLDMFIVAYQLVKWVT